MFRKIFSAIIYATSFLVYIVLCLYTVFIRWPLLFLIRAENRFLDEAQYAIDSIVDTLEKAGRE